MDAASTTLTGALPSAFSFLGQILLKWVPATVSAVVSSAHTVGPPASPLFAWSVPDFLAQASDPSMYTALAHGWILFSVISLLASIPFILLMLYCTLRIQQVRYRERRAVEAAQRTVAAKDIPKTQLRWNHVLGEANDPTPEKWRLAILEADIMLNELLDVQGYKGETMADKLKMVDRANWNTIDLAWEAHKIRNRIAHEGSEHEISARETRRVIALYEKVFKEFRFVE